jgi:hypothetical protein
VNVEKDSSAVRACSIVLVFQTLKNAVDRVVVLLTRFVAVTMMFSCHPIAFIIMRVAVMEMAVWRSKPAVRPWILRSLVVFGKMRLVVMEMVVLSIKSAVRIF